MSVHRKLTSQLRFLLENHKLHKIPCNQKAQASFQTDVEVRSQQRALESCHLLDLTEEEKQPVQKALKAFEETFKKNHEVIVGSAQKLTPDHHAVVTLFVKKQSEQIPECPPCTRIDVIALEFQERHSGFLHQLDAEISGVKIIHHDFWG